MSSKLQLYPHQIEAQKIMERMEFQGRGGFLCDSPGMGKTLTMAYFMRNNKRIEPDLIICPVSVLSNWVKEIKRVYESEGDIAPKICVYHGPNRKEFATLFSTFDYVIASYTILGAGELTSFKWGRIILDEAHQIRNGLKKNAPKCAKEALQISKNSYKNWALTATPYNNKITDVAAQAAFVGTLPYAAGKWWNENKSNELLLSMWREKFVLRRTKDGILPPPLVNDVFIDPTEIELRVVNGLRASIELEFLKWKSAAAVDKFQIQTQILALIIKLRQASNSFYIGSAKDIDNSTVLDDCAKVNRLITDLDKKVYEDPNKAVVVFSQFTSFLDLLHKILNEFLVGIEILQYDGSMSKEDRDDVVNYFNTSKHPRIILVSLLSGGVGLSLHKGSSTVFITEPFFNPFIEQQAEERVHRLGQDHIVNIYRYNMKNSVECWINTIKKKKLSGAFELDLGGADFDISPESFREELDLLFEDVVSFTTSTKVNDIDKLHRQFIRAEIEITNINKEKRIKEKSEAKDDDKDDKSDTTPVKPVKPVIKKKRVKVPKVPQIVITA